MSATLPRESRLRRRVLGSDGTARICRLFFEGAVEVILYKEKEVWSTGRCLGKRHGKHHFVALFVVRQGGKEGFGEKDTASIGIVALTRLIGPGENRLPGEPSAFILDRIAKEAGMFVIASPHDDTTFGEPWICTRGRVPPGGLSLPRVSSR